jgi:uncharacterized protein
MDELQFECDEDKATQNFAKHGVSFLTAAEIYRVAYTWRGEMVVRIITAQKANRHERETYYHEIFT